MTAACTMSTWRAGTLRANTKPGMPRAYACGVTKIRGGGRPTAPSPTAWYSTSRRDSSTGIWRRNSRTIADRHAQGIRVWGDKDPWWVQAHGTFANGVVFDITQGFIYGHLAKEQPHNCYVDAIGTKGVARMRHDFAEASERVLKLQARRLAK